MRSSFSLELEEMSSLSVASAEPHRQPPALKSQQSNNNNNAKYLPARLSSTKGNARDYRQQQRKMQSLSHISTPSVSYTSAEDDPPEKSELVQLLWQGKWQATLELLESNPDEASRTIQLPDISMASGSENGSGNNTAANGSCNSNNTMNRLFIHALPLHLACAMRPLPPTEVVKALVDAYPAACKHTTGSPLGLLPLHLAADLTDVRYSGYVAVQEPEDVLLESRNPSTTTDQRKKSTHKESPNQAEIAKLLLEIRPESILLPETANDMLPLHIAASSAKPKSSSGASHSISPVATEVMELLVEAGPPQVATRIKDKSGMTPLDHAWKNMQCQACQNSWKGSNGRNNLCQCRQGIASTSTHPLLQSVIKSHLGMLQPAIRETEGGFIKPPMQRRPSKTASTSSGSSSRMVESRDAVHSPKCRPRSTTPTVRRLSKVSASSRHSMSASMDYSMAERKDEAYSAQHRPRGTTPTKKRLSTTSTSSKYSRSSNCTEYSTSIREIESRKEANSVAASSRSTTPTMALSPNAAQALMKQHLFSKAVESVSRMTPALSPQPANQAQSSPKQRDSPPSAKDRTTPSPRSVAKPTPQVTTPSPSSSSNKMYMKAIQSSSIRSRFKSIESTHSPVPKTVECKTDQPITTTDTNAVVSSTEGKKSAFEPYGSKDPSLTAAPLTTVKSDLVKSTAEQKEEVKIVKPIPILRHIPINNNDGAATGAQPLPMIRSIPLKDSDDTVTAALCFKLHLSHLVHPNAPGRRSVSPGGGGRLRRSNSFGSRKSLLPNPCFEVFLAHRAGLSKGYYKSYPLQNTSEGSWDEAFIATGLTRRQLEYGIDGGSHVEVGIRVLHCPSKGSEMQLIGTTVISLETLEQNAAACVRSHEYNKYPILHGYEVKGWLQVLSFRIK